MPKFSKKLKVFPLKRVKSLSKSWQKPAWALQVWQFHFRKTFFTRRYVFENDSLSLKLWVKPKKIQYGFHKRGAASGSIASHAGKKTHSSQKSAREKHISTFHLSPLLPTWCTQFGLHSAATPFSHTNPALHHHWI